MSEADKLLSALLAELDRQGAYHRVIGGALQIDALLNAHELVAAIAAAAKPTP